eukprot:scaffold6648_cov63-Phaeocystis_antarctica.AAC.4
MPRLHRRRSPVHRRRQGAGLRCVIGRAQRAAAQGAARRVGRVGARACGGTAAAATSGPRTP